MNITLYAANWGWVTVSIFVCLFILLVFWATFHAILFARWTPNTFTEVREDLARLEDELARQKAVPFEEQLSNAFLVSKEMWSKQKVDINFCMLCHAFDA